MCLLIAEFLGHGHGAIGTGTGGADQNHRQGLVFNRCCQFFFKLAQGHVFGTHHMASRKFTGFTDVNNDCFFPVHQLHGTAGAQGTRVHAARYQGPYKHAARGQGNGNQHPVIDQKFHFEPFEYVGLSQ